MRSRSLILLAVICVASVTLWAMPVIDWPRRMPNIRAPYLLLLLGFYTGAMLVFRRFLAHRLGRILLPVALSLLAGFLAYLTLACVQPGQIAKFGFFNIAAVAAIMPALLLHSYFPGAVSAVLLVLESRLTRRAANP